MKEKHMKIPRKLKKAFHCKNKCWWNQVRLWSKYQYIFNPYFSCEVTKFSKIRSVFQAYYDLMDNPNKTIEELCDMYGRVTGDEVEYWNNEEFRMKYLGVPKYFNFDTPYLN